MAAIKPKANLTDGGNQPDPVELEVGELAVNAVDGKVYVKTTAGEIVEVGADQNARMVAQFAAESASAAEPLHLPVDGGWAAYGESGSYLVVGGESGYRSYAREERRGSVEVYGAAADESGNPLAAEIVVCARSSKVPSAFRAATMAGSSLVFEIYGENQTSGAFGTAGSDDAAIYLVDGGDLRIGFRSTVPGIEHEAIRLGSKSLEVDFFDSSASLLVSDQKLEFIDSSGNPCITAENQSVSIPIVNAGSVASNRVRLAPGGNAGNPELSPTGDPDTGIYFPSADTVAVSTGDTERLRVDSVGNVGVGAASAGNSRLYVKTTADSAVTSLRLDAWGTVAGWSGFAVRQDAATRNVELSSGGASTGSFTFINAIDHILTLSQTRQLLAETGLAIAPSYSFTGDTDTGAYSPAADTFAISTGGTERLRVESGGTSFSVPIIASATSGSAGSYLPSVSFAGDSNTGFGTVGADKASVFAAGDEMTRVGTAGLQVRMSSGGAEYTQVSWHDSAGALAAAGVLYKDSYSSTSVVGVGAGGYALYTTGSNIGLATLGSDDVIIGTGNAERMRVKASGAINFKPRATDPANGDAGDVYYNSSTNKLRVHTGTSWIDLH